MSDFKEDRQDDGGRPRHNDTVTAQGDNHAPKARQPNEHDESADSQAAGTPQMREIGSIAHDAATSGQQDTSKAQETDATYHRMRQGADPAPDEQPGRGDPKAR